MHDVYDLYTLVMSIELRQLRCLVAIAEAGSFTDAAIDLGISQAAASRTLASLEAALGVRLLRRTTREVTLTAAGGRVLAHARRALAAAEDVVREAAALHDSHVGVEHITLALTTIRQGLVPEILAEAGAPAPALRAAILDRYRRAS